MPVLLNSNTTFLGLLILVMLGSNCNRLDTTKLNKEQLYGLWSDDFSSTAYFLEDSCFLHQIKCAPYQVKEDELIVMHKPPEVFQVKQIHSDTILIKMAEETRWQKLHQPPLIHNEQIVNLKYYQLSDLSEFSIEISASAAIKMAVDFHPRLKAGQYIGNLNLNNLAFLNGLWHSMNPEISPILNPNITSDSQEWAVIINTASGKQYHLYHNYQTINKQHTCFASHMNLLPLLIEFEKLDIPKKWDTTAKKFKQREFQRNLEMNR